MGVLHKKASKSLGKIFLKMELKWRFVTEFVTALCYNNTKAAMRPKTRHDEKQPRMPVIFV